MSISKKTKLKIEVNQACLKKKCVLYTNMHKHALNAMLGKSIFLASCLFMLCVLLNYAFFIAYKGF